jgi:transposase-like protein
MVTKDRFETKVIRCPKCQSSAFIKDGIIKEKQRVKCKECNYRYTVLERGLGNEIRRQALQLYLAGLGFRSIGRLLNCSHVTVREWINEHGDTIKSIRASSEINVVKTDNLHTYIDARNTIKNTAALVYDTLNDSASLCIHITPKVEK